MSDIQSINNWHAAARPNPTQANFNTQVACHIEEILEMFEEVQRMTSAEPLTRADLPRAIIRQLVGPNAKADEGFVLVFPNFDLTDGEGDVEFARQVRSILVEHEPDGFIAMAELQMPRPLRPFLAVWHQL